MAVVKLLRELYPNWCCLTARAVAEASGHCEVTEWLDKNDPELVRALEEAVAECKIDDGRSANNEQVLGSESSNSSSISSNSGEVGQGGEGLENADHEKGSHSESDTGR